MNVLSGSPPLERLLHLRPPANPPPLASMRASRGVPRLGGVPSVPGRSASVGSEEQEEERDDRPEDQGMGEEEGPAVPASHLPPPRLFELGEGETESLAEGRVEVSALFPPFEEDAKSVYAALFDEVDDGGRREEIGDARIGRGTGPVERDRIERRRAVEGEGEAELPGGLEVPFSRGPAGVPLVEPSWRAGGREKAVERDVRQLVAEDAGEFVRRGTARDVAGEDDDASVGVGDSGAPLRRAPAGQRIEACPRPARDRRARCRRAGSRLRGARGATAGRGPARGAGARAARRRASSRGRAGCRRAARACRARSDR